MSSPAQPSARVPAARWAWPDVVVPVAVLALEVALQVVMVHAMLRPDQATHPGDRWLVWDGQRYLQIAEHGYPSAVRFGQQDVVEGADYAFFPLYPVLVRLVHLVLPVGWGTAAVAVSGSAAAGFAVALHRLARLLGGSRRAGVAAVAALGALPMSVVLTMGYAESLWALLATLVLAAVLRGRAWTACLAGLACALTRPTAVLLLVPLFALVVLRRDRVRAPLAAGTGVAVGLGAWWTRVALAGGQFDTLARIQEVGWGTRFDAGRSTWTFLSGTLQAADGTSVAQAGTAASLLAALVGVVCLLLVPRRRWLALLGVGVLAMVALESNYWHSKPRLLLALAPLLASAAVALEDARLLRGRVVWLVVAAGVLCSSWFGAWMLDVWPYAI